RRNSNGGGAVTRGVGKINGRFEPWDESLVAISSRIRQAGKRGRVFQDSADEKERGLTESGVTVPSKKRLVVFPKRHMRVHARPVIGEDRFWHERHRFIVPFGDITQDVFVILHVVAHAFERRE